MHVPHIVGLVLLGCAIALAACGSSSKPKSTVDLGTSPQGVKYSDCMRSHGVPDFPDLNPNGSVSLPSSINPQSPAFQSAEGTCASLRPQGSPPPPITLAQQKSFTANAKCTSQARHPRFPGSDLRPGRSRGWPSVRARCAPSHRGGAPAGQREVRARRLAAAAAWRRHVRLSHSPAVGPAFTPGRGFRGTRRRLRFARRAQPRGPAPASRWLSARGGLGIRAKRDFGRAGRL